MHNSSHHDRTLEGARSHSHASTNEPAPTVLTSAEQAGSRSGDGRAPATPRRMPEKIGEYRLLRLLGQGGMGVVYEAEQQSPRRLVALKVMRQGHFVDDPHTRMFHREAETLGRLKHPGIAAIYESGHTEDGHDFFAMELVQGRDLDAWVENRPTPISPAELELRLRVFRAICDAVNYAHLRGVIHRDLKPSNIIVTDEMASHSDSAAVPLPGVKVLDFGLARIMDTDVQGESRLTEAGTIKGTLQYMSPEQARGDADAVDVPTDVYALGMILYEMLTLQRPYDLARSGISQAIRVVCDTPPKPLSQVWSGTKKPDPDLETIVRKALEKEPKRRYSSAAALSEDVERYLTSQPIKARPPSATYRARKYVQRHRLGVSVAAAAALTLVAFTITMTVQAERVARERDRASREAEVAKRVSDFVTELFNVSDPSETRGKPVTVRELLDKGARDIKTLADRPEVQAKLMTTMGRVYSGLGLHAQAESLLAAAAAIQRQTTGADNPETLAASTALAREYVREGRYEPAERILRETIQTSRRALGFDHQATLDARIALASIYADERRLAEAGVLDEAALKTSRRLYGDSNATTLTVISNLAGVYAASGRAQEALKLNQRALTISRRLNGENHPTTLRVMTTLSDEYKQAGRLEDAEALSRETLEATRRVMGAEHPQTAATAYDLARVLARRGKQDEALDLIRQALDHGMRSADAGMIPTDPDLDPLRGDSRFTRIAADAQRRAPSEPTTSR